MRYVALFDFTAVGEMEILLHRYDLLGRLEHCRGHQRPSSLPEAPCLPGERVKHNVGQLLTKFLGQRTSAPVAAPPARLAPSMARSCDVSPAPEGALVDYEPAAPEGLGYVAKGGVIAIALHRWQGRHRAGLHERPNARGYDLITIYDDE